MNTEQLFAANDAQKLRIKILAEGIVNAEAQIERMQKDVAAKRECLIAVMQQGGIDSVKLDSGLAPRLETKQRIGKRKEAENEAVFAWLTENGLGDIIRPAVNPKTLAATMAEFVAEGGKVPQRLFHQFEQPSVRFNGRAKFLASESV